MNETLDLNQEALMARREYDTPESRRLRFETSQATLNYDLVAREYSEYFGGEK
jgi:hypothetical protein